jgi:hypothetical protein
MNKLLSTPIAMAVSATFLVAVNLTACTSTKVDSSQITTEEAARIAAEKKRAAERRRAQSQQSQHYQHSSGSCGN